MRALVTYEFSPEPTPEEREALERALDGVADERPTRAAPGGARASERRSAQTQSSKGWSTSQGAKPCRR